MSVTRSPPQLPNSTEIPTLPAPDLKLGLWRQSCDRILVSLEDFSQKLLNNAKRFRENGDKSSADVISSSCITCLAHLAILYEVVCQTDPVAGEMYKLCDSALQRLGMQTYELQMEEYTYLDLLLGVRLSLHYFQVVVTQTGDRDSTLGGNRYQSSRSG